MEIPSASEYLATIGSNEIWVSFRYGIKLDGKWEHQ